jgi:hypothetical protein
MLWMFILHLEYFSSRENLSNIDEKKFISVTKEGNYI